MVMDSKSQPVSPQSVGREFVRQYYTLLHQEPLHLHRFYSEDSSFVHGGLDSNDDSTSEPVHGQQAIHQLIKQLNFQDCHAKIRQVDAHATLADGVVVQVSGELSNRGQQMRRFMQTFVLAPQSPKKYYVINDIFRYQDEVFLDDEQHEEPQTTLIENPAPTVAGTTAAAAPNVTEENVKNEMAGLTVNNNLPSAKFPSQQSNVGVGGDGITTVSINPAPAIAAVEAQPVRQQQKAKDVHVNGGHPPTIDAEEVAESSRPESVTSPAPDASAVEAAEPEPEAKSTGEEQDSKQASGGGQRSYANLVKSGPAVGGAIPVSPNSLPPAGFTKSPQSGGSARDGASKEGTPSPGFAVPSGGGFGGGKGMRGGRVSGGSARSQASQNSRYSTSSARGDDDGASSRDGRDGPRGSRGGPSAFPDSQQVFVGNLPHNCSEPDLASLFGQYGKVVEIRISVKGVQQSKVMPSGQGVPNFGFVVFDSEEEAKECLSKVPIHLPDGHRLNVETKRNKRMRGEGGGGGGFISTGGNSGQNVPGKGGRMASSGQGGPAGSGGSAFGSSETLGNRSGGNWGGRGGSRGGGQRGGGRGGGAFSGGRGGAGGSSGQSGSQSIRGAYGGPRRT